MDANGQDPPSKLPMKTIPGSYGVRFFSPIKDRLDYYYNMGEEKYFKSRIDAYGSTVFRCNVPPGPFMAGDSRVIAVLDAKSFPILFDVTKVEKKDILYGTFIPSTALTGGYRVCAQLDPSEPKHAKLKQLIFNLVASRKAHFIPEFQTSYSGLFDVLEGQLAGSGASNFNKLNNDIAFEFFGKAFFGVNPSTTSLGPSGVRKVEKWLLPQLCPLVSGRLPWVLEEIFFHTFPIPFFLVKGDYRELFKYFSTVAADALADAERLGISRDEACHNIIFVICFNAYGAVRLLFPGILQFLARAGSEVHARLATDIRSAVRSEGGKLTVTALETMELAKSVVYEALRLDPPVKYQYAVAKQDLVIESHDTTFQVKAGETIFGYQPLATRDARVFQNADDFVPDRFVGEEGKKLLRYVVWSNGPETESPTVGNKQCPGKDLVVLLGRLLVAELFLRYDTFTAEIKSDGLGAGITFTSVTKAGS